MRKIALLTLISVLLFTFSSCGKSDSEAAYKIYYLNTEKTSIVVQNSDLSGDTVDELVTDALDKLSTSSDGVDYIATIPSGVNISGFEISDGTLSLYLSGAYSALDIYTEILVRAAIVKTLVQIDGVDSVAMYLDNSPLTDSNGDAIGLMTADTFIEDFGEETDSLLSSTLTLYFASADGTSLVAESRTVYYSRNVAIEKLIIDQLLNGPDSDDLMSTLPTGTKLNSISVSDEGICYVNFDAALETGITGVTENVTVYSIVDSLTELDSIKEVQILVNGETPHLSNLEIDLSNPIIRNEEIINDNSSDEDITDYSVDEDYTQDEEDIIPVDDTTDSTSAD